MTWPDRVAFTGTMMPVTMQIRRGTARFTTREPGRSTRHSLSFGEHYDPGRLRIGPMLCHDEHVLGAGRGFERHPHEGLEILTWVLEGVLQHEDSLGTHHHLRRGDVAVLSAGSGVEHSELAVGGPCRFVQAWLRPDDGSSPPSYACASPDAAALAGRLRTVASATDGAAPVQVGTAGATLQVARLAAGESVVLDPVEGPAGSTRHVFVAAGALTRFSIVEPLEAGDAIVVEDAERQPPARLVAAVPTELMVWTFAAADGC